MNTVRDIWTLKIRHDYFADRACRWGKVVVAAETLSMVQRRNCGWVQAGVGEWKLICYNGDNAFNPEDKLEMEFFSDDFKMSHYTWCEWRRYGVYPLITVDVAADSRIDMDKQQGHLESCPIGAFFKLIVPLKGIDYDCMRVTEIAFQSPSCYWEYWLIPRDGNINRELELAVSGVDIEFVECEGSSDRMNRPCLFFRSTKRLKVIEKSNAVVSLFEMLDNGIRKPLMRNLPLPELGRYPNSGERAAVCVSYF